MAVVYVCSDTLTGIRTPLCRTSLGALVAEGMRILDEATAAATSGVMQDAQLIASACERSDPGSCRSSRSAAVDGTS